jgi:hypothetical protein
MRACWRSPSTASFAARKCSTTFEQPYLRFLWPSPRLDSARLRGGISPAVARL